MAEPPEDHERPAPARRKLFYDPWRGCSYPAGFKPALTALALLPALLWIGGAVVGGGVLSVQSDRVSAALFHLGFPGGIATCLLWSGCVARERGRRRLSTFTMHLGALLLVLNAFAAMPFLAVIGSFAHFEFPYGWLFDRLPPDFVGIGIIALGAYLVGLLRSGKLRDLEI